MKISMLKFQAWPIWWKPAFLCCFSKRSKHIFGCHMSKTTIPFGRFWFAVDFWRPKLWDFSSNLWPKIWIEWQFSVLFLLCFRVHLFIDALWTPAWKGLTSWLSFVMSYCEVATFQLVSWVRCGLDCIDSWSLPSFLLSCVSSGQHP